MENLLPEFQTAFLGLMAAGFIALFKQLGPLLHQKVPGFLWPLVAMALAWAGTETCKSLGAVCKGNPLDWNEGQATAISAALLAVVSREALKGGRPFLEKSLAKLRELGQSA